MENDVLYNRIMNKIHEEYGPPINEEEDEIQENENDEDSETP